MERCQGWDDGAEVVDVGFAWASEEEEAGGQKPHGAVCKEGVSCVVEEPGFLPSEAFFFIAFLQDQ